MSRSPIYKPMWASQVMPWRSERRRDVIDAIVQRFARLPELDGRSADDILGYDENGLPT